MPPFKWINQKTLVLHRAPQQFALPSLQGRATWISGVGALRHLVIDANHLHWFPGCKFVKTQIHSAAAIVARALGGVRDKNSLIFGSSVPEYLCDIPRTVSVMNQQSVAQFLQGLAGAQEGLGCGPLQE